MNDQIKSARIEIADAAAALRPWAALIESADGSFHGTTWRGGPRAGGVVFRLGPIDSRSCFLRGECNDDGTVDISDTLSTLAVLFRGDGEITCQDACDSNDDGKVNISDVITTIGVLFLGKGVIPPPGVNQCGVDPTDDQLGCETYERCPWGALAPSD